MARYKTDWKGIAALKRTPEMHAYIAAVGAMVADASHNFSTRDTGHYDAGIEPRMMGFRDARCRVYAHDFKSHWMEYGAGPSPVRGGRPFLARQPLRKAVLATGLRFSDRRASD
jgi:hypothetical protein